MTGDEIELTLVTMEFDAAQPDELMAVLAKYVVLSRGHVGCRNIDLCASDTTENRYLIIQKWASAADQQRHFDSPEMVEMATACTGLLVRAPRIDLLHGISAHDLA
jgi:quinol monooxygenase YgiN